MRVAHIIKVVRVAGAEQHLLTLLPGLRARQVDARLMLIVEPANDMAHYIQEVEASGVPVDSMTIQRHVDLGLYRKLAAALRELRPDIVHTHLLHADLYGIPAARWARIPAVVTSRHNDNAFRRRFPIRQVNQALWHLANGGIAISESLRRFSIEVEGASPGKVKCIYYGLEAGQPLDRGISRAALAHELHLPPNVNFVGVACRLIEQKGVSYGLRAFAHIANDFPHIHFIVAGDGPLRAALQTEAQKLGLANRVHFLGWRENINALLAALDIFLAPSLWEGFGLVMLEAMGQQLPIIASAVSAIPEIVVDSETGLLVPPRDVNALSAALRQLLSDKPLYQHMGLLGRDRLETRFSAARMIDDTLALYQSLLSK
jgi:glycosyltransferase involved in cell wall biosynthesis